MARHKHKRKALPPPPTLEESFARRLRELDAEGKRRAANPDALPSPTLRLEETTVERLAQCLAATAKRFAEAVVSEPLRDMVLCRDEIVQRWPLEAGQHWRDTTEARELCRFAELEHYGRSGIVWPPDCSFEQAAQAFDGLGAQAVAEELRRGRFFDWLHVLIGLLRGHFDEELARGERDVLRPENYRVIRVAQEAAAAAMDAFRSNITTSTEADVERGLEQLADRLEDYARKLGRVVATNDDLDQLRRAERISKAAEEATSSSLQDDIKRFGPVSVALFGPAVALLVALEAKVREARSAHVRVPHQPILAVQSVRSRDALPPDTAKPVLDPSGRTFQTPTAGFRYWRFGAPPHGVQLSLPLPDDPRDPHSAARAWFTGQTLRFYAADWVLTAEQGHESLAHVVNPRHVLLDVLETKAKFTTSKGRRYARPQARLEAELVRAYETFERTMLIGFGDKSFDPPEVLLSRTTVTDKKDKRSVEVWNHAHFAREAYFRSFMQVPRRVLTALDPRDTPLALGVAALIRQEVQSVFRGGRLALPAAELAARVGEPVSDRVRREGRAYWPSFFDTLSRVVTEGGFGKLHVGKGAGGDVVLTIEPSDALDTVYRPLLARAAERQADAIAAQQAADVAKLLGQPRGRGRPRKRG